MIHSPTRLSEFKMLLVVALRTCNKNAEEKGFHKFSTYTLQWNARVGTGLGSEEDNGSTSNYYDPGTRRFAQNFPASNEVVKMLIDHDINKLLDDCKRTFSESAVWKWTIQAVKENRKGKYLPLYLDFDPADMQLQAEDTVCQGCHTETARYAKRLNDKVRGGTTCHR